MSSDAAAHPRRRTRALQCLPMLANNPVVKRTRVREGVPLLGGILGLVTGGGSDMSVAGTEKYIQLQLQAMQMRGILQQNQLLRCAMADANRTIADVKLLRDLPASIAQAGIKVRACARHWCTANRSCRSCT